MRRDERSGRKFALAPRAAYETSSVPVAGLGSARRSNRNSSGNSSQRSAQATAEYIPDEAEIIAASHAPFARKCSSAARCEYFIAAKHAADMATAQSAIFPSELKMAAEPRLP